MHLFFLEDINGIHCAWHDYYKCIACHVPMHFNAAVYIIIMVIVAPCLFIFVNPTHNSSDLGIQHFYLFLQKLFNGYYIIARSISKCKSQSCLN